MAVNGGSAECSYIVTRLVINSASGSTYVLSWSLPSCDERQVCYSYSIVIVSYSIIIVTVDPGILCRGRGVRHGLDLCTRFWNHVIP